MTDQSWHDLHQIKLGVLHCMLAFCAASCDLAGPCSTVKESLVDALHCQIILCY